MHSIAPFLLQGSLSWSHLGEIVQKLKSGLEEMPVNATIIYFPLIFAFSFIFLLGTFICPGLGTLAMFAT